MSVSQNLKISVEPVAQNNVSTLDKNMSNEGFDLFVGKYFDERYDVLYYNNFFFFFNIREIILDLL